MTILATHLGLLCAVISSMPLHSIHANVAESASDVGTRYRFHVGQNVTLPCHTSLEHDVDWMYQPSQSASQQYVYSNGIVYVSFRPRFRVDRPSTGDFNLIIADIRLDEAGFYTCTEDGGLGTGHIAELIVIAEATIEQTTAVMNGTTTAESRTRIIVGVVIGAAVLITVIVVIVIVVVCRDQGNGKKTQPDNKHEINDPLLHGNKDTDETGNSQIGVATNKTNDLRNATNSASRASTEDNTNNNLPTASSSDDNRLKHCCGADDDVPPTTHEIQRDQQNATYLNVSQVEIPDNENADQSMVGTHQLEQMLNGDCAKDDDLPPQPSEHTPDPCDQAKDDEIMEADQMVINNIGNDAVEDDKPTVPGKSDDQDKRTDPEDTCSSPSGIKPLQGGHVLDMACKFDTPVVSPKSAPVKQSDGP